MKNHPHSLTRRSFLQATGALGVGAMLTPSLLAAETPGAKVARRKFGKTGVDVPIASLGCMFDIENNQIILRRALEYGVNYWDTAAGYGKSETGIGMYFEKNPEARKDIFLVSKASGARSVADMTDRLEQSLTRMKTDHIDLYFVHGISTIDRMTQPEIKAWAEQAKKAGKIKFFGFSTHTNMEQCMMGAAKLGWIDAIMMTYNFRNMHTPEMKAAVEACTKAGIALTAMKTIGKRNRGKGKGGKEKGQEEAPEQNSILDPLKAKGYTEGQAALKMVMQDQQIATACVQMPNLAYCKENIAAALDRKELTWDDREAMQRYAAATCSGYCAGCSHICESALAGRVPVRDVMRHLMYHHNYTQAEVDARALFRAMPSPVRTRLAETDYAAAERVCPNRLPIGQMMREAVRVLA